MSRLFSIAQKALLVCGMGACFAFPAIAQGLLETDGSEEAVAYKGQRTEETVLAASRANIDRIRKGTLIIHARPGAEITVEQVRHEFRFGTAITQINFNNQEAPATKMYLDLVKDNFNAAVLENNMKWQLNEPQQGVLQYAAADAALKWCDEHGFPLRGHTVFWGVPHQIQGWVKALSDEDLRAALENRAMSVVGRYRGRVRDWDVYNEMMHSDYFGKRLGPGIVAQMFAWCRTANPEARLFVNEYGILTGRDADAYFRHIADLRARGIPVGGIGMQGHFGGRGLVNAAQVQDILDRLWNTFQLPMAITEFDVNVKDENVRAENLRKFYTVAFGHEGMEEITMWGFLQGHVWKPHTHLWNKDGKPNAAGRMYRDLVYNQWWTRHQGRADASGTLELRALYGDYIVTVDGRSFNGKLEKRNGRAHLDARPQRAAGR
jgi:GH35 family endo-1,4-beta-xylanase